MKVWFIASWWPTRVLPRHGNFVEKHARVVGKLHELTVLAVQLDESLGHSDQEVVATRHPYFYEFVVYYGCRPSSRVSRVYRRLRAYITAIRRAYQATGRPAILHGHVVVAGGGVAGLLATYWGLPYLLTEHSTRYVRPLPMPELRLKLVRLVCANAFAVLPVSTYLADAMARRRRIPGNYRVVSNVVDVAVFAPHLQGPARAGRPFRLLHVSNFREEQKNIGGILRVIRRLTFSFPGEFHLMLAGDGNIGEVRQLVASTGLTQQEVCVSGPHTEEEIAGLMNTADGFVFFSHYETQGVVLLEALCVGLPCVASRVGPIPEIIEDGVNGYLVPPGDEEKLYQAIIRLKQSAACFDRASIRRRSVELYSEESVGAQLDRLYHEAL